MTTPSAHAAPLPDLALIEVAGPDAAAFLQAQLSNDVRAVTDARAQLSSWSSARGRLLAVLHVIRAGDAYWLEVHRSLLEPLLKKLRLYVLRSKVTLREADWRLAGISGPGAEALLGQLHLPAPAAALDCAWRNGAGVMRRLGVTPRYSLFLPVAGAEALLASLGARAAPATPDFWRRADIEAGVPVIFPQTQDRFVPQMCNLDTLGGISFGKGCYPGQEVVARVHYRGAVKRHLERVALPGPPPAPGAELVLPDGRPAEVVDAVALPDGGALAQVVAQAPPEPLRG